ncbi:MAG: hypothetical protein ACM3ZQ_10215, partial [Bacillota bacterium]
MLKKIMIGFMAVGALLFGSVQPVLAATGPSYVRYTRSEAIARYTQFMPSYLSRDQKIVDQFRAREDNSAASKLVERAIWYMEHGYMVYGHQYKGYKDYGIVDCSNFVSLVYGDLGYNITTTARNYGSVGTRVNGVYSTVVGKSYSGRSLYGLAGMDNLKVGDILTWWAKDSNGNKYISHTAIYMGIFDGKPAVIGTTSDRPTAIGIVTDFRYWWGENFDQARRVLPAGSTGTVKAP